MRTLARDEDIRKLIKSWNPAIKLLLIVIALFATAPVINFVIIPSAFNNLFLYNTRFGGFALFCFFLIWKKGKIANIVLTSPIGYKKIEINNVYLRSIVYLSAIIILSFSFQELRYLLGISPTIFPFKTGFWDFVLITFFAPISEEVYYRFLIIYLTDSILGRTIGIVFSLSLFILSHDYFQIGIVGIIWITSLALTNTAATISFGSLWPAIGIHIVNNMVVYFKHPF